MTTDIDVAIVGAGIVGLMLAKKLYEAKPNLSIALFEKNLFVGEESSSRNSGVIHSGIYYETGSFKHLLSLEGNNEWEEIAKQLAIPFNRCGKYIVATTPNERDELELLKQQGEHNRVKDIRNISSPERKELNSIINIFDAIYLPTTGIIDVSIALKNLERWLFNKNIPILLNQTVEQIEPDAGEFNLYFKQQKIQAAIVVNACGLKAIEFRKKLGLLDFEADFIKGNYLSTNQKLFTKSLIYPIPHKDLHGLGVHSSFDFNGKLKFGPNTETISTIDYAVQNNLKELMWPQIEKLFKKVAYDKLYADYAGIRSKIKRTNETKLYPDFLLQSEKEHKIKNYYEFCGIDSPGLTASPGLANWMIKKLC